LFGKGHVGGPGGHGPRPGWARPSGQSPWTAPAPGVSLASTVATPLPAAAVATAQPTRSPVAAPDSTNSPAATLQVSLSPKAISAAAAHGSSHTSSMAAS